MKRALLVATIGLGMAAIPTVGGHAANQESAAQKPPTAAGQEPQLDPRLPGVGDQEQDFAYPAHALLAPLVDMSRLGVDKASDPELADLSRKMASEYADLLKDLEKAAQAAGIDAAKGEAPHASNRLDRLQVSGDEFDLAYVIEQQGLHEKLINMYGMEARAGQDALSDHAQKGRKILADNMAKIEQIEGRLHEARTSPTR